jgi:hypothetical protein
MGRFAVDLKTQGCGLGKFLLVDAMKRIQAVAISVGVYARRFIEFLQRKIGIFEH